MSIAKGNKAYSKKERYLDNPDGNFANSLNHSDIQKTYLDGIALSVPFN